MIRAQLADAHRQWQSNRRLRVAVLVVLAVLALQLVLSLSDSNRNRAASYQSDRNLLTRLQSASQESQWPQRAEQLREQLNQLQQSIPTATSEGLAQAELQARLNEIAQQSGLLEIRVQAESAVEVPGRPELWQVLARLDAVAPEGQLPAFLKTMSEALPWLQMDQLEVREGARTPLTVMVRAYFMRPVTAEPTP